MKSYASFCPVAKTAEIFAERWTPLILRELCVGARRFSELQMGLPLISRALLTQRLRELELTGVIARTAEEGTRSSYRLTEEGEAFRPLIEMMAMWGQTYGRGRIQAGDTDPMQLVWGIRRHLDMRHVPSRQLVIQFEFTGVPKSWRGSRYWWLAMDKKDIDVCQKNPGYEVDVTIIANLKTLTLVWLGHRGLSEARGAGDVVFTGDAKNIKTICNALCLREQAWRRDFDFSMRPDPFGPTVAA